jgi:hypothetical protein
VVQEVPHLVGSVWPDDEGVILTDLFQPAFLISARPEW